MSEMMGFALVLIAAPIAYLMYQIARSIKNTADTEELIEKLFQNKIFEKAKSKGIDLRKEIIKQNLFSKEINRKSFRSKLRDELHKEYFKEETK